MDSQSSAVMRQVIQMEVFGPSEQLRVAAASVVRGLTRAVPACEVAAARAMLDAGGSDGSWAQGVRPRGALAWLRAAWDDEASWADRGAWVHPFEALIGRAGRICAASDSADQRAWTAVWYTAVLLVRTHRTHGDDWPVDLPLELSTLTSVPAGGSCTGGGGGAEQVLRAMRVYALDWALELWSTRVGAAAGDAQTAQRVARAVGVIEVVAEVVAESFNYMMAESLAGLVISAKVLLLEAGRIAVANSSRHEVRSKRAIGAALSDCSALSVASRRLHDTELQRGVDALVAIKNGMCGMADEVTERVKLKLKQQFARQIGHLGIPPSPAVQRDPRERAEAVVLSVCLPDAQRIAQLEAELRRGAAREAALGAERDAAARRADVSARGAVETANKLRHSENRRAAEAAGLRAQLSASNQEKALLLGEARAARAEARARVDSARDVRAALRAGLPSHADAAVERQDRSEPADIAEEVVRLCLPHLRR